MNSINDVKDPDAHRMHLQPPTSSTGEPRQLRLNGALLPIVHNYTVSVSVKTEMESEFFFKSQQLKPRFNIQTVDKAAYRGSQHGSR